MINSLRICRKRSLKKQKAYEYHGVHPRLQGFWVAVYGEPRRPPDWLPGHSHEEFKRQWLKGYDEYMNRSE